VWNRTLMKGEKKMADKGKKIKTSEKQYGWCEAPVIAGGRNQLKQ